MPHDSPDVLIVGAGIVGCAVGEALGRQGARVRLIDPRGVGFGATQASAAMLVPYCETADDPLLGSLGARSLALFEPLMDRITDADVTMPLLTRTSSLEVAMSDAEAVSLKARAAALREAGTEGAFIPSADARRIEPRLSDCSGALHIAAHAFTRAEDFTQALWRACVRQGAELTRSQVQRIQPGSGDLVNVVTPEGTVSAPTVVLAAGSWAGHIEVAGADPMPVRPIRGQLLQLDWDAPPLACILWSSRCYVLSWQDGTMLAGATVEDVGYDERATVAGVRDLLDGLCELVPAAAEAGFRRVRVGLRPQTPDGRPAIGRSRQLPGLMYATGHYRNGVLLAPLTGELVVRAFAGEDDPAFASFDPQRFGNL